jgi:tetraacyldisaccharide-1-P 4'-kinase
MLHGLGADVDGLVFKDHHSYTLSDVRDIMDRSAGRDLVVTTEKDLVKINPAWFTGMTEKLFAVRVGIEMPGLAGILDEIEQLAENSRFPG